MREKVKKDEERAWEKLKKHEKDGTRVQPCPMHTSCPVGVCST